MDVHLIRVGHCLVLFLTLLLGLSTSFSYFALSLDAVFINLFPFFQDTDELFLLFLIDQRGG